MMWEESLKNVGSLFVVPQTLLNMEEFILVEILYM